MTTGNVPIGQTMGFHIVDVSDGEVTFEATPNLAVYNPIGTVHGGFAAAILDSCCGCAAHTKLSPTQAYTTLELKVAYHKPITVQTGLLRGTGRVISIGRRAAFTEATLKDLNGTPLRVSDIHAAGDGEDRLSTGHAHLPLIHNSRYGLRERQPRQAAC